jgi:hypothetical protein
MPCASCFVVVARVGLLTDGHPHSVPPHRPSGSLTACSVVCCVLAGTLPSEYGNLTALQHIRLSGNRLKGGFPASWGGLADLRVLVLGEACILLRVYSLHVCTVCPTAEELETQTAPLCIPRDASFRAMSQFLLLSCVRTSCAPQFES